MPIMAIYRARGVSPQDYAKFRAELPLSPAPAEGIFHAYGSSGNELVVVDVWDEEAAMDRFIDQRLKPALAKAGIRRGLDEDLAATVARETVLGTAWMAAASGESMDELARRVASPRGTTEAGLAVLDREGVLDGLIDVTIQAAGRRAAELAAEARPGRQVDSGQSLP